ncbi:MAG: alanine racemase, partial [Terracidiphilus sp.]
MEHLEIANPIGPLNKGLGPMERALMPGQAASLNWNLLREDLSLPCAILYRDRLLNNQQWMRRFIESYGVKIAPHGKTTMAPQLFHMQLQGGAWGITMATAQQTRVGYEHGVRRILMANQLIGRQNMAIVAQLLRDPGFTFYCLVDSADGVDALGAWFAPIDVRVNVLIELGVMGGRAGVRNEAQLAALLEALDRCKQTVCLSGVEIYEGVLDDEASIRAFLRRACDVTAQLLAEKRFAQSPPILTGAGSAWFDVVAEEFTSAAFPEPVEIVLRPGCYLTHDVGSYLKAHARMVQSNPMARQMGEGLLP